MYPCKLNPYCFTTSCAQRGAQAHTEDELQMSPTELTQRTRTLPRVLRRKELLGQDSLNVNSLVPGIIGTTEGEVVLLKLLFLCVP